MAGRDRDRHLGLLLLAPLNRLLLARARRLAGAFFLALTLSGCAALLPQTTDLRDNRPAGLPDRVELADIAFVPQAEYQCGPAALSMALASSGAGVPLDRLVDEVYLPAREGSLQADMQATPRRHGRVSHRLAPRLDDVLREVAAGNPVIVLQNYGVWPFEGWHYALVVGYDYPAGEAILHSGERAAMRMPFAVFEYLWRDGNHWAMAVTPPHKLSATAREPDAAAAVAAFERVAAPADSAAAWRAVHERWPHSEPAAVAVANAEHGRGDFAAAEATLRAALAQHPHSPVLLNNLAQTLSDLGRHDEALARIDEAATAPGAFAAAIAETRAQIGMRLRTAETR